MDSAPTLRSLSRPSMGMNSTEKLTAAALLKSKCPVVGSGGSINEWFIGFEIVGGTGLTLVAGARRWGEVPPATPLFTLIDRARRSSRSASSAKSSRSGYRHDKSREFRSRSHRRPGDVAEAGRVRQWLCPAPEFNFNKMNAEPMAAHLEFARMGHDGMERRV